MPTSWLISTPRSYFETTRERGFDLLGFDAPNSRRSRQMSQGDSVVLYIPNSRTFAATATVTSKTFEGHDEIWKHETREREPFRNRVHIVPITVAEDPAQELDAMQLGPSLEYVKRWPPEWWHLALHGMVHIISQRDFDLLDTELKRSVKLAGG